MSLFLNVLLACIISQLSENVLLALKITLITLRLRNVKNKVDVQMVRLGMQQLANVNAQLIHISILI